MINIIISNKISLGTHSIVQFSAVFVLRQKSFLLHDALPVLFKLHLRNCACAPLKRGCLYQTVNGGVEVTAVPLTQNFKVLTQLLSVYGVLTVYVRANVQNASR